MSSLSTNAGSLRPENFHIENVLNEMMVVRKTDNGILMPTYPKDLARYVVGQTVDIYSGRDLKDFHKRKSAGELLPFTNYSKCISSQKLTGSLTSINTVPGHIYEHKYYAKDGSQKPFMFAAVNGTYPFDYAIPFQAQQWISNRGINLDLYPQLAASVLYSRGWDAGTFLAELHKTIRMVRNLIPRLAKILSEFRDIFLRRSAGNNIPSDLLQSWLEGRYGWRILMYDYQDAREAVEKLNEKQRTRVKQRIGETISWTDDLTRIGSYTSSTQTYNDLRTIEVSVRGSIVADFIPDIFITNPGLTLWEIIPYSFVLDWVYNVGAALEAIAFLTVNSQYTASKSFQLTGTRVGELSLTWNAGWSGSYQMTCNQEYQYIWRDPTAISISPQFDNRIDLLKAFDLVALFTQLITPVLTTIFNKR
jgi:hypothetical protein